MSVPVYQATDTTPMRKETKHHDRSSKRRSGLPVFLPLESTATGLIRLATFFFYAGVAFASPMYIAARIAEQLQLRSTASILYAKALRLAESSNSRSMMRAQQLWEFFAERNLARNSEARVEDSLFFATALPDLAHKLHRRARCQAPGFYEARFTHRGLRIDGYLRPDMVQDRIDVVVDGRILKTTTPVLLPLRLPFFVIGIWRDVLAALPASARLELRLSTGESLLNHGSPVTLLELPHGLPQETAWQQPVAIDKKGFLVQHNLGAAALQQGFLRIYKQASEFYEEHLGTSLFVLYGTLLGQHRGRDFIPGDDDFDVGYYSDAATSQEARREGMEFVVALVKAGFVVTLNREGRLFRLRLPGMPPACHLDVHAVWRERGSLWIHPFANLDCQRDDLLPAKQALFHGQQVLVPAHPERFLEAYYGSDWKTPDPAYSTVSRPFSYWKKRHLERSLVTPKLLQAMHKRIEESSPHADTKGMLLATGLQSIYPLERYEALCDW